MPRQDRHRENTAPQKSSPDVQSQTDVDKVQPVHEVADLAKGAAPRVEQVHPVAETMGNDAAQSMVDDWVSTQHGGPENPDDPEDMWFWQHRTNTNWDFAEDAELSQKGGQSHDIADGTIGTNWDLGTKVSTSKRGGDLKTTTSAHARGGYDRERLIDGVTTTDSAALDNQVKRVRTKDRQGNLKRTTDVTGGLDTDVAHKSTDGDVTHASKLSNDLSWGYSDERTGKHQKDAGGFGTIFTGDTYDTTTDQASNIAYDGDYNDKTTTRVEGGKDVHDVKVGLNLSGERARSGDKRTSEAAGTLKGSVKDSSTRAQDDGSTLTHSRKIYGELGGKRSDAGKGAKGWGKAKVGMAGEREEVAHRDDGTKVTTTLGADGSVHGRSSANVAGKQTHQAGADLDLSAARKWERERADGTKIIDEAGVTGSLGGSGKKVGDKGVALKGTGDLGASASRTLKGTRDDGAKTTTKFGGKVGAHASRTLPNKDAMGVDAELSASHAVTQKTDTGSVTDKVYGKASGGVGSKTYKAGARATVDGAVEVGGSRKTVTDLDDGSLAVELGGKVTGSRKAQEVAGGTKYTNKAAAQLDASRTRKRTTDTGDVATTLAGAAKAGQTTTTGPDGKVSVMRDGALSGDWSQTTTEKTAAGTAKSTVGLGGDLHGKSGTNAKGERVRNLGGKLTAKGNRTNTVTDADGSTTETSFTSAGELGADVDRVGDKATGTGKGKLSVGAQRVRKTTDGDVAVTNTAGADLTGTGSAKTDGTGDAGANLGLKASQKRAWTADGHTFETVANQSGGLGGDIKRTADGWENSQNAKIGAGKTRKETWTDAAGVKHQSTGGLSGELGATRSKTDTRGTASAKYDRSDKTTTTNADGSVTTHTVGDAVTGKGDLGLKKGADGKNGGVSADWKRTDATSTTRDIKGGKQTDAASSASTIGGGYASGKGPSLNVGQTWASSTEQKHDDGSTSKSSQDLKLTGGASKDERQVGISRTTGASNKRVSDDGKTTTESSNSRTVAGGLSTKSGLSASVKNKRVDAKTTQKLSDTTTLTTTSGEVTNEAAAGINRDKDGNPVATASAKASATAFSQNVAYDNGKGLKGSAGYEVGKADANAKGTATMTDDGVAVKGNAGAKVTLVGGNAKVEVPAFTWNLLGEPVRVKLTAGVSASVVAEAEGNLELNVSKADNLGVTVGGGGKAFAGAKAGVEVGAHIQWLRHDDYSKLLMDFLDDLPGVGRFVEDVPVDLWKQISGALIGSGTSDLVIAKAGLTGSAGIGGEASFGLSLQGGRVKMNGDLNGAIGIGGGAKTSLDLDAVDGIRFGGVMGLRGAEWVKSQIAGAGAWMDQVVQECRVRIDEYMESKKAEGGFGGAVASAVDWLGDDLFDLW